MAQEVLLAEIAPVFQNQVHDNLCAFSTTLLALKGAGGPIDQKFNKIKAVLDAPIKTPPTITVQRTDSFRAAGMVLTLMSRAHTCRKSSKT